MKEKRYVTLDYVYNTVRIARVGKPARVYANPSAWVCDVLAQIAKHSFHIPIPGAVLFMR